MTDVMDGRELARQVEAKLAMRVEALKAQGIQPQLVILVVGRDERTASYIRAKQKAAERVGIRVLVEPIGSDTPGKSPRLGDTPGESGRRSDLTDRIRTAIERWNADPTVHGIILQLPLPNGIDDEPLLDAIDPNKDVDGLTATNQAAVELGRELFPPATPMGILRLLDAYHIEIADTVVAVIGQGRLVGKPLSQMLEHRGARVRTADSSTSDLRAVTAGAEVIISATGQPHLITADLIDDGVVLIDAGLSEVGETLVGDITPEAAAKARLVTPVPGGVGPMTVVSLLSNVVVAAELVQLH